MATAKATLGTDAHPITPGTRVRIHKNLNSVGGERGLWVVRVRIGKGWKVAGYRRSLLIQNATAHATPAGVARIERRGRRDVVAWIEGDWVGGSDSNAQGIGYCVEQSASDPEQVPVTYNPFRDWRFLTESGEHWTGSAEVAFPQGSPCAYALEGRATD